MRSSRNLLGTFLAGGLQHLCAAADNLRDGGLHGGRRRRLHLRGVHDHHQVARRVDPLAHPVGAVRRLRAGRSHGPVVLHPPGAVQPSSRSRLSDERERRVRKKERKHTPLPKGGMGGRRVKYKRCSNSFQKVNRSLKSVLLYAYPQGGICTYTGCKVR